MGTGWRRAFCTTIPTNNNNNNNNNDSSHNTKTSHKLGLFSSNPSTPRLPKTNNNDSVIDALNITPRLRCKTNNNSNNNTDTGTRKPSFVGSSPRSPFSIFKSSLGFTRSNCGVCLQSVKTGHKTAIFTAECSHAFHFPCISNHVKHQNVLACPVCKTTWKDATFLASQNTNFLKPKPYHDDEPLQTPRPGVVPVIPEAAVEDTDADQEFKGFFVNPVLSDHEFRGDFKNVEVMLMSEVALINSTQSYETYAVVLKVKAPPQHVLRRAPVDLVAVLHVTATKLQMLKRAMRLLISSLGSADRLSIVAFSACFSRLLPLTKMGAGGQRLARRVVDQLACGRGAGESCAGEALKEAARVLQDRRERNPVASIILLSDGHMNNSHSNQRQMSSHASSTRFAHMEIPVQSLEKTYSHENAFTKCVGGLLTVVAQDLRIEVGVGAGSSPVEISAVYSCDGKPRVLDPGSVRFGDLYAEEEREVLVELRVPKSKSKSNRGYDYAHHVLSVRCVYKDPATQEKIYGGEKALVVPAPQPNIQRLRNLFIATRAVAESRLLVEHNKLTTAYDLLSSARDLLMRSMSGQEFVKGLESELLDVQWRVQQQGHRMKTGSR